MVDRRGYQLPSEQHHYISSSWHSSPWYHHSLKYQKQYTILLLTIAMIYLSFTILPSSLKTSRPLIITCLYNSTTDISTLIRFLETSQKYAYDMDIHVIVPHDTSGDIQRQIHTWGATVFVKTYPTDRTPGLGRFTLLSSHLTTLPTPPPKYILLVDVTSHVLFQSPLTPQIHDMLDAYNIDTMTLLITREHARMNIQKCHYTKYYMEIAYPERIQELQTKPLLSHVVVMGTTSHLLSYVKAMQHESNTRSVAVRKVVHMDQGIHNYVIHTYFTQAQQIKLASSPFYSLRYVPNDEKRMDRNALIVNQWKQAPAVVIEYTYDKVAIDKLHDPHSTPVFPDAKLAKPWHIPRKGDMPMDMSHDHSGHQHQHEHDHGPTTMVDDDDESLRNEPEHMHEHHDEEAPEPPHLGEDGYYAYAPELPDHPFKPKDPASGT